MKYLERRTRIARKIREMRNKNRELKEDLRLSRDKEAYYVGKIKGMQEMIKILYR